jgi:hypothetical protein
MATVRLGHREVQKPDGSTPEGWFAYTCGHCGRDVAGYVVAYATTHEASADFQMRWLQCPTCRRGSVYDQRIGVAPGVAFGPGVAGLPADVNAAYAEARRCLSVQANTAAEGMCRKILMHIALDKGAAEGKTFAFYIDYLAQQGYVTPPMQPWVALIRDHGNEAQHRIDAPDRTRAEGTLFFTAQLLRMVYEMGHIAARFVPQAP